MRIDLEIALTKCGVPADFHPMFTALYKASQEFDQRVSVANAADNYEVTSELFKAMFDGMGALVEASGADADRFGFACEGFEDDLCGAFADVIERQGNSARRPSMYSALSRVVGASL